MGYHNYYTVYERTRGSSEVMLDQIHSEGQLLISTNRNSEKEEGEIAMERCLHTLAKEAEDFWVPHQVM